MLGWVCMCCQECTRIRRLNTFVLTEQGIEIENLKARVKQYADYDEIKRELGIMKVCSSVEVVFTCPQISIFL